MARCSDPERVRTWQRRFARFRQAGLSVARFCRQEGVSAAAFYQWRKRLAPTGPSPVRDGQAAFANVRLVAADEVRVKLRGGTQLRIPCHDPDTLRLALQTLAQADAQLAEGGEAC